MITFVYCRREKGEENPISREAGRRHVKNCLHHVRQNISTGMLRRKLRRQEISRTITDIPDGQIICYYVSCDLKSAKEQIKRIPSERIWYEKALAEALGLNQPELYADEIMYLVQGMQQGKFGGSKRESLLVIEPLEETEKETVLSEEAYQEILQAAIADCNHYTIVGSNPQRYEALAENAWEQDGLLLQCVNSVPREYPLGEHLLILNFRTDCRIRPWLLKKDACSFLASTHGIVNFLDTAVKKSYNILS